MRCSCGAGHLRGLSGLDVFGYLHQEHDATHVAMLLGLGAAHAGTCDEDVSRSMFIHMPGRHPQVPAPMVDLRPPPYCILNTQMLQDPKEDDDVDDVVVQCALTSCVGAIFDNTRQCVS